MCSMNRYWIRWNKMIEEVADERISRRWAEELEERVLVESGSQKECGARCAWRASKKHRTEVARIESRGEVRRISKLEREMWQMAQSYGYGEMRREFIVG